MAARSLLTSGMPMLHTRDACQFARLCVLEFTRRLQKCNESLFCCDQESTPAHCITDSDPIARGALPAFLSRFSAAYPFLAWHWQATSALDLTMTCVQHWHCWQSSLLVTYKYSNAAHAGREVLLVSSQRSADGLERFQIHLSNIFRLLG